MKYENAEYSDKKPSEVIEEKLSKDCVILEIENLFLEHFVDYCSIENDLLFIKEFVERLLEFKKIDNGLNVTSEFRNRRIITHSLFTNTIVTYGRCFNKSNGRKITLNIDFVKKSIAQSQLELEDLLDAHKKLLNLRNKFIAHNDITDYSSVKPILCMIKNELPNDIKFTLGLNYYTSLIYNFSEEDLEIIEELVLCLINQVDKKKMSLSKKIFESVPREELIKYYFDNINV